MPNAKAAPRERRRTRKLIADLGGPTIVASWLKLTPQAVSLWETIPARHIVQIAAKGKVARERIRPDLYRPGPGL